MLPDRILTGSDYIAPLQEEEKAQQTPKKSALSKLHQSDMKGHPQQRKNSV
jgi:hypothetical protein